MVNRKTITGIVLVVILILTGFYFKGSFISMQNNNSDNNRTAEQDFTENNGNSQKSDPIKEQVEEMTLQEKIGQMVIVGFDGYTIDDNLRTLIENHHVGGVILFGRNIKDSEQLLNLNNSLKSINLKNKIPLFISVDEEGGRVSRMPEDFKKLPANKIIGEVSDENLSYEIGSIISEELGLFGFNMDFAPVLDINSNPQNPVIGDRSYGDDAETVSRLGVQAMKGIQSGGVIPVVKHFPGHGDTSQDSHVSLPTVNHDLNRIMNFELVPFMDAVNKQADAVMIAHILLNKIDPENPSSLSKIVITDILRNQLKFNGIVITDDMTMGAIIANFDIDEAAVKSINAGSDIILICHEYDKEIKVINALVNAVEKNIISLDKIDESVYRILTLKDKYKLSDDKIDMVNINNIHNINVRIDALLQTQK